MHFQLKKKKYLISLKDKEDLPGLTLKKRHSK